MGSCGSDGGFSLIQRARALFLFAFALLVLSLCPAPAAAQSTQEYWHSLQAERRPDVVLTAAAPASVPIPVAEALRLFRVYEVSGDEAAARRARELLRRASVADEHRAWQALALAMVLARGPDSRMRVDDGWFTDPNSLGSAGSLRLLRRVLELQPDLREAALELGRWSLDRDHPAVAAEALIALSDLQADAVAPADADVLRMQSELELFLGYFRSAAGHALEARSAGADPSVTLHMSAYAFLQGPATAESGVEAYFEGARALTSAGREAYGRVLAPVLTEVEAEEWRGLDEQSAADWLGRFWRRSAARAGVTLKERLAEHYRRTHEARVEFPSIAPLSTLQNQAPFAVREDSRRFGLSLRGLMLVRHGDPLRVAHLETCLSNPWPAPGAGTICPAGYGPDRLGMFQQGESLVRGDSYNPFVRPLAFGHALYAFRGVDGGTDIVFAVALTDRAANALVEGSREIAGLLSALLLPDSGEVVRRDSVFRAELPERLVEAMVSETDALALLHATVVAPAADSSLDYRITVSDLSRHAGAVAGGRLDVPSLTGFALSDLVVAPSDAPGTWERGEVTVALAPFRLYAADETFRLYYELYGVPEDTPYRTEIELTPVREGVIDRLRGLVGDDEPIRLRFEGRTPAPHATFGVQELRTVRLEGVEPGVWRLRVVVTDLGTGRVTRRETLLDVATAP